MIAAFCNGEPATAFALDSRAAHYGDGAFTTIRVHAGQACWWPAHRARLHAACRVLQLQVPDLAALEAQVAAAAALAVAAVIKVLLVPRAEVRGYARDWPSAVDSFVFVYAPAQIDAASYRDGIRLHRCERALADAEPFGIKTLSRLPEVLAAARPQGELLRCDRDGYIGCARSANVIVQFGDLLVTPPTGNGIIDGVARATLLQSPPTGFSVRVQSMHRDALLNADAVILSNAVRGFVPVAQFGAQVYSRRDAVAAVQHAFHPQLGLPEP